MRLSLLNNISPAAKSSIALFISSLVTMGIAYLTTPIYTRLLTSEEFGQVSVYLTWQNVLGIIAMFCLMNGVFNNGMVDYPDERDNYSFSMLGLSNLITIITGIVLFVIFPLVKGMFQLNTSFWGLMFAVFITQPAFSFWSARQRYEYKWKWLVFWSILIAVLSPLIAIICIYSLDISHLYSRIYGAFMPMIVVYIGFYIYLGARNHFKIDTRFWKEAFRFNLPLIPHYLSSLLLASCNVLIISKYSDFSSTAYYSVAHSISSLLTIAITAVNASLIPYTYEKCKACDHASIAKVTMPILYFLAVTGILLVLIAPEVLMFMATPEYHGAVYVIPPVVLGVFFQALYYIFANVVFYYKKPVYVMIASVTATVANIVLGLLLVPKYGYLAAGYITLFCYALQAAIDYYAMKHVVGESIYNMKKIVLLSLVTIILGLLCMLTYKTILLRYSILLLILVGMFIKRKTIMAILKFK
jgi:O-antigen/teichoic acid export membrane protein